MRRISTLWTKNLKEPASKDSFEMKLRSMHSDSVFKRLIEILKERSVINSKTRYNYDNRSWAYLQAHINGQQQLIEELLELLLIDKEIK